MKYCVFLQTEYFLSETVERSKHHNKKGYQNQVRATRPVHISYMDLEQVFKFFSHLSDIRV